MGIKIRYLGHSSFIINMNGNNILTDPYFDNKDKCELIVSKYYSGGLKIDPRILFDSFKTIKTNIFEKR